MKNYVKNFKSFILESVESNAEEVKLLDQKKALQVKLRETKEAEVKTEIEKQIALLDGQIDKLRETEVAAENNDV
jgi:hypothetical protein